MTITASSLSFHQDAAFTHAVLCGHNAINEPIVVSTISTQLVREPTAYAVWRHTVTALVISAQSDMVRGYPLGPSLRNQPEA